MKGDENMADLVVGDKVFVSTIALKREFWGTWGQLATVKSFGEGTHDGTVATRHDVVVVEFDDIYPIRLANYPVTMIGNQINKVTE